MALEKRVNSRIPVKWILTKYKSCPVTRVLQTPHVFSRLRLTANGLIRGGKFPNNEGAAV